MAITTYIFDLDDTIIDSSIYARMYNELINTLLSELKISEIALQEVITKLKEEKNVQKADSFDLCYKLNSTELYYNILEKYAKHTYTLKTKNIPVIFKKIKANNKKIGVISGSQLRTIELFLKRFNLLDYTDFIESGKKDTILFWITLEKRHNLEKEDTIVIDDSDEILKLAEHAGYKTLHVSNIDNLAEFEL